MPNVTLKNVRLSFPHLFAAQSFNGEEDKAKFSTNLLIDPATPEGKAADDALKGAINEVIAQKWPDGPPKNLKVWARRDGTEESDREEYQGLIFLNPKTDTRPLVVDRDGKTPLAKEDGRPYGGCYCNVSIGVYATKGTSNTVSSSLRWVQFVRDGEAFGPGQASVDEIEALDDMPATADAGTDAEVPAFFN